MAGIKSTCRGSLSLEAAIILPAILLLASLVIGQLQAIGAEIKIKAAMDRTASEISLFSPLCDLLNRYGDDLQNLLITGEKSASQSESDASSNTDASYDDLQRFLLEFFPDDRWKEFLTDAALDLTSTVMLGPFVQSRFDYWLGEAWSGQSGWLRQMGRTQLYLDWRQDKHQLWLCLSYELKTPGGICHKRSDTVVPIWIGHGGTSTSEIDQIWQMDNFTRGKKLREVFGGNLPDDFPVIARFSNHEATAIKSMDLTAPSYQSADIIRARICTQIGNLVCFNGAIRRRGAQDFTVSIQDIATRRLLLIIPQNSRQPWLSELWDELRKAAGDQGVLLEIKPYGISSRYLAEED